MSTKNEYSVLVQRDEFVRGTSYHQVVIVKGTSIHTYKSALKILQAYSLALALANNQDAAERAFKACIRRRTFKPKEITNRRHLGSSTVKVGDKEHNVDWGGI